MIYLATSPFISAYVQSDWLGKLIFLSLFALSAASWTILVHKTWAFHQIKKLSIEFSSLFSDKEPLSLQFARNTQDSLWEVPHPYFEIYKVFKQKTLLVISKNHFYSPGSDALLTEVDLGLIESSVDSAVLKQHKLMEKNLFILSTIATLGPFLGLLGTVWGILLSFTQLNGHTSAASNAAMLSGLSMALATTVIGLVIAIPALAGYNYLKNLSREYLRDMEDFSQQLIAAVELQHRRPEHAQKTVSVP